MGIGDELIVTGQCRVMQKTDPRKVRIVYEKPRWFDIWLNNPRIAVPNEQGDFQELKPRTNYLRPYMESKTRERWTWKAYRPPPGEIYLTEREKAFGQQHAGRFVLEPGIKLGASPNKQWGRWQRLTDLLLGEGIQVTQLGPAGTQLLVGTEFIETRSFRDACAVLSTAKGCVVPEGAMHHACAALGTPAVVIFGGYISPKVTGYDTQVNLFTGSGLGCGSRMPCKCCERAMAAIKPEAVVEIITKGRIWHLTSNTRQRCATIS